MKLIKPKFWDKNYLTFQSILLYPFTFIIDVKNLLTSFKRPIKYPQIKTICVGNIYIIGQVKRLWLILLQKVLTKNSKQKLLKKISKSFR